LIVLVGSAGTARADAPLADRVILRLECREVPMFGIRTFGVAVVVAVKALV